MKQRLASLLLTLILVLAFALPTQAADLVNGAQVFSVHCAACHAQGGNLIRRGKTLKQTALTRYGMNSLEAIEQLVTNGKNNMSAYRDRLSIQQIEDVSAYVLAQAQQGWRSR